MIGVIFKGIRTQLLANSTIGSAIGTRAYRNLAPQEASLPLLVITIASGGDTNTSPRDELDVDVDVRFVSSTGLEAQTLGSAARDALHRTAPTLEGGWVAYDCQHEQIISYVTTEERRQYYHEGGTYRLRATKDS